MMNFILSINNKIMHYSSYMTKEEHQHLIDTILEQQETIIRLREKIAFLHTLVDSLGRELERARGEGKL